MPALVLRGLAELRQTRSGGLLACMSCGKTWLATWARGGPLPACPRCSMTGVLFEGKEQYDAWVKFKLGTSQRRTKFVNMKDVLPDPPTAA